MNKDSKQSTVRPLRLESSRASPFPQPADVPNRLPNLSFESSAVKGSGSNQRDVGLNIFTAGRYSSSRSSFQVTFLPNTVSPSKSLLFLPPTPPPKIKSQEEVTVPLSPVSDPNLKSNQFVTTYPVRSPDHEFPNNILSTSSPSLPTGKLIPSSPFIFLIKNIKTIQCLVHPCSLRKAPTPFPLCRSLCHFPWLPHPCRSSLSESQVPKDT